MIKSEFKTQDGKVTFVFDPHDSYSVGGKTFTYASIKKFVRQPNGQVKTNVVTFGQDKNVLEWLNKCLSV